MSQSMDARPTIDLSTVLVTGGAGFIGSHLVDALYENGASKVIIVDNLFTGERNNLKDALKRGAIFYNDDIEIMTTMEYILSCHKIDIVFNCATKALNYSFVNPRNAYETNVSGVLNLLECQRKGLFKTLVHFSTSEVYGTAVYEPMDENHPINPTTTYAAGKAAADLAVKSYVSMYDLDSFIVRPFNNYGPRQNYKGYLAGIIPITAWRILNDKQPEIHGSGNQSRDFIFVKDTVDSIIKLYPLMDKGEAVNISTKNKMTVKEVLSNIFLEMGYTGTMAQKNARNSDVYCHNSCNEKILSMIDYKLTPFNDGLKKTINWYKENIE